MTLFESLQLWSNHWAHLKLKLGAVSGLSPDALHINAGLLVLCLAALVLRRSPLSVWPWLALLVLECSNEAADLMLEGMGSTEATVGAGLHDIANTMAAPTLLLLVGWWQRRQGAT
ncbi:MAG: hypothetical protein QFC78_00375 [Pseudomonadota bacterium]|nr:hypothetical protein [Pseudomonadota bacterium]